MKRLHEILLILSKPEIEDFLSDHLWFFFFLIDSIKDPRFNNYQMELLIGVLDQIFAAIDKTHQTRKKLEEKFFEEMNGDCPFLRESFYHHVRAHYSFPSN